MLIKSKRHGIAIGAALLLVLANLPATQAGNMTVLSNFNVTNGEGPDGGMAIDASGDLFGTTFAGGASGLGSVFELAAGSGTITTLGSFAGSNGELPGSGVTMDANGNLFGTTEYGGPSPSDGSA